jgi:hypothetical protein
LFANHQDYASDFQEIKLKLIKWIASPILFDTYQSNYLETNVTEVGILNTAGVEIQISNLADDVEYKEPFTKFGPYNSSLLNCKSWDKVLNKFTSSGCQAFEANYTELMCQT